MRRGERESGHEVAASDRVGELDGGSYRAWSRRARDRRRCSRRPSSAASEARAARPQLQHTVVTVRMAANAADAANLVVLLAARRRRRRRLVCGTCARGGRAARCPVQRTAAHEEEAWVSGVGRPSTAWAAGKATGTARCRCEAASRLRRMPRRLARSMPVGRFDGLKSPRGDRSVTLAVVQLIERSDRLPRRRAATLSRARRASHGWRGHRFRPPPNRCYPGGSLITQLLFSEARALPPSASWPSGC